MTVNDLDRKIYSDHSNYHSTGWTSAGGTEESSLMPLKHSDVTETLDTSQPDALSPLHLVDLSAETDSCLLLNDPLDSSKYPVSVSLKFMVVSNSFGN